MEKYLIEAEKRDLVGKKVKMLRQSGKIPAVIYGKDLKSLPITLDRKTVTHTLSKVSSSTLLTIKINSDEHAVLVREIQQDFIRHEILHIDFLAVSMKEKLRTNVPLVHIGSAPVLKEFEALIVSGLNEIEVECLPQDLPESIEIDLSGINEIGSAIYVKDIPVPANVHIITDPEELVVVASAVKEEVVEEVVVEEVEAAEEPEVIEHGKKEETEEEE